MLLVALRQAATQATVVSSSKLQSCMADGTVRKTSDAMIMPDHLCITSYRQERSVKGARTAHHNMLIQGTFGHGARRQDQ
jgi:hypothetical protein